jgi:hypothetical protein
MFSKKARKIDKIFTVDLTLCISKCQIDDKDFVNFCGLLRKHELYLHCKMIYEALGTRGPFEKVVDGALECIFRASSCILKLKKVFLASLLLTQGSIYWDNMIVIHFWSIYFWKEKEEERRVFLSIGWWYLNLKTELNKCICSNDWQLAIDLTDYP